MLILDGRHLEPVVSQVEGVSIPLRTFVVCHPAESARRDILYNKRLDPDSEKGKLAVLDEITEIVRRDVDDLVRPIDPVRPDRNAINYFRAGNPYANGGEYASTQIAETIFTREGRPPHPLHRMGVGFEAQRGVQVLFDTTRFSREPMVDAYEQMLLEALSRDSNKRSSVPLFRYSVASR